MPVEGTATRGMRQVEDRLGMSLHAYLLDAYLGRGLATSAIGAAVGVDKTTVARWLRHYGVEARYVGYRGRAR